MRRVLFIVFCILAISTVVLWFSPGEPKPVPQWLSDFSNDGRSDCGPRR